MSDRPVSETAAALEELRSIVRAEMDQIFELVRDETAAVAGALRSGGGSDHVARVADEIDEMSRQLGSALGDLPGVVDDVVGSEIAELRGLVRPSSGAGAMPGLADVATFAPSADAVVEFATEAEFNAAANSPSPNTTYRFGDVEWRTDELGRTVSVVGTPRLEPATRDPRLQATIGREGRATDVGFHLLGHALGGPTNRVNVVSGNGVRLEDGLANLNQGAYQKFENEIRMHLKAGRDVRVEIQVVYDSRNGTRRPDEFVARLSVDGDRSRPYRFVNK